MLFAYGGSSNIVSDCCMSHAEKRALIILRIVVGWFFFYAGVIKVMDPAWSAAGYLNSAKTFSGLYHALANPSVLPVINFINEWGLVLLGLSLILGISVRISSIAGIILMTLYYFPRLQFPHPTPTTYLIDEHIIYIAVLLVFATIRTEGLSKWCAKLSFFERYPGFRKVLE